MKLKPLYNAIVSLSIVIMFYLYLVCNCTGFKSYKYSSSKWVKFTEIEIEKKYEHGGLD